MEKELAMDREEDMQRRVRTTLLSLLPLSLPSLATMALRAQISLWTYYNSDLKRGGDSRKQVSS